MSKAIVDAWFRERLSSGPIARDTPAYNQIRDALPDLVARLDAARPAPAQSKAAEETKAASEAPPPAPPAPAAE